MGIDTEHPRTKRDFVIAVWESLDCETVGAQELEQIQSAVAERFGEGAVESPASLARIVADEGAHLRHPEVLDCDAKWREKKLSQPFIKVELKFSTLSEAAESIVELDNLRKELAKSHKSSREFRDAVIKTRQDCLLIAESSVLSDLQRAEAREIAGWLEVWLRTPELFADWLELRRSSPEFRQLFDL